MSGRGGEGGRLRAVALGGGHGLHATLSALRRLAGRGTLVDHITAVVTVADDGGSSGRLRRELGVLPPGDLRMAMDALAADHDPGSRWRELLQHRFGGSGALAGHAVGNLLLAGLIEVLGDPVAALDEVGVLLGLRGRVLPMSCEPLDIEAEVTELGEEPDRAYRIRGQVAVGSTRARYGGCGCGRTRRGPAAGAAAVRAADVLFLGPGSWFSSVPPHLLVPELRGRDHREPGPPGGGAQPGPGARRDGRVLPRTAPGTYSLSTLRRCAWTRCSPTLPRCRCPTGCAARRRACVAGRAAGAGAGRRRRSAAAARPGGARRRHRPGARGAGRNDRPDRRAARVGRTGQRRTG